MQSDCLTAGADAPVYRNCLIPIIASKGFTVSYVLYYFEHSMLFQRNCGPFFFTRHTNKYVFVAMWESFIPFHITTGKQVQAADEDSIGKCLLNAFRVRVILENAWGCHPKNNLHTQQMSEKSYIFTCLSVWECINHDEWTKSPSRVQTSWALQGELLNSVCHVLEKLQKSKSKFPVCATYL